MSRQERKVPGRRSSEIRAYPMTGASALGVHVLAVMIAGRLAVACGLTMAVDLQDQAP
jgi:hypothetical protein